MDTKHPTYRAEMENLKRQIKCAHCEQVFNSEQTLKFHYQKYHEPSKKPEVSDSLSNERDNGFTSSKSSSINSVASFYSLNSIEGNDESSPVDSSAASFYSLTSMESTNRSTSSSSSDESTDSYEADPICTCEEKSALRDVVLHCTYTPVRLHVDVKRFLKKMWPELKKKIKQQVNRHNSVRWYLKLQARVKSMISGDEQEPSVKSQNFITMKNLNFKHVLSNIVEVVNEKLENWTDRESGFTIEFIMQLDLWIFRYNPLSGRRYLPLPEELCKLRAIVNIVNQDDMCGLYALLAALHHKDVGNPEDPRCYRHLLDTINVSNVTFPIGPVQMIKLARTNNLNLDLYGWDSENSKIFPMNQFEPFTGNNNRSVSLLFFSNSFGNTHFAAIKDFDSLMSSLYPKRNVKFYCKRCLVGFRKRDDRDSHFKDCAQFKHQSVEYPKGDRKILKFRDFHMMHRLSHVIYADLETTQVPVKQRKRSCDNKTSSYTKPLKEHVPCGYGLLVVGPRGEAIHFEIGRGTDSRGRDIMTQFLDSLFFWEKRIAHLKKQNITISRRVPFTPGICFVCRQQMNETQNIVPDHCHYTGDHRNWLHRECNLKYRNSKYIPVIMHNLRNFDCHLIMQTIGQYEREVQCLPRNKEKYVSFKVGQLRFIDSLQFLPASLDSLCSNLASDGLEQFHVTRSQFPDTNKLELLTRKGVFPYEWLDCESKFGCTQLPPRECFYNRLKQTECSDSDYAHAQKVWQTFKMKTFADYFDLYLKSDILILSDIFESFRNLIMSTYDIDPCHLVSCAGVAWQSALRSSDDMRMQLLTDPTMHLMIERGIRGGLVSAIKRFDTAQNKYTRLYDPREESKFLMLVDVNNLYGAALSMKLPIGNPDGGPGRFEFLTDEEIGNIDWSDIPVDEDIGYICEVDLDYPKSLHMLHSDLPMAPELKSVTRDLLPPHLSHLAQSAKQKKLLPNLWNKRNYVLHFALLKFYLRHGLVLKKVHRAIRFRQEAVLADFISKNTVLRQQAKNDFDKSLYKFINNSVYGKSLERKRNHRIVHLVTTPEQMDKMVTRPTFKDAIIFNKNLVAVEMLKSNIILDRPIYLGFTCLEYSKLLMYQLYYDVLKPKYGDRIRIAYMDTDSLLLVVLCEDLYEDIRKDLEEKGADSIWDTSDYKPDHKCYFSGNKKVIGKIKDELNGAILLQICCLKAKMYSLLTEDQVEFKKVAKGVARTYVKNTLRHRDYLRVLKGHPTKRASYGVSLSIRNKRHKIFTNIVRKRALDARDNKRVILRRNYETLPYGHFLLQNRRWCSRNLSTRTCNETSNEQSVV